MKKLGRKYVEAAKKVDKNQSYSALEAAKLAKETSITNFDGTIDFAIKLNVDPKKADQQLRGSLVLPNGTGKTKRILVIAKGAAAEKAKEAGADYVGDKDMIDKIQNENWFDFDVIVATPDMMPELGKIGKILGPKGLMPNPKTNTVTPDPAKAIEDINKGMIEFRTDSYGNIHGILGKVSFDAEKLAENLENTVKTIARMKSHVNAGGVSEVVPSPPSGFTGLPSGFTGSSGLTGLSSGFSVTSDCSSTSTSIIALETFRMLPSDGLLRRVSTSSILTSTVVEPPPSSSKA